MRIHRLVRWLGIVFAVSFAFAGATCLIVWLFAPAIADHCGVTILSPILAAVCLIFCLLLAVLAPERCHIFHDD